MHAPWSILFADRAREAFIGTIRQILDSSVKILNTRSAIGRSLELTAVHSAHVYEVRPRKDKRGARQSNFRRAALRLALVWRTQRDQQRS